ncbi:MAG: hypothetical protein IJZ47_09365 [Oscillospiraceae bacterium]|nr:hypothetical protein [Oscillospiraceae bacterium]
MSIKEYYDKQRLGISAEDMTARVTRAAQEQPKHRAVRKPAVIAAAAAVVVMAGGVTAAATGMFNINDIFGGRINAQDEQLAEALVAAADLTWTVSDEDYMIELKGVTGSEYDMMVALEISREDGKPVTDFMTNIPEDGRLICMYNDSSFDNDEFEIYRYSTEVRRQMYLNVNDEGNVDVCYMVASDGCIADADYRLQAMNLYPEKPLREFEDTNDVFLWYGEGTEVPTGFYSYDESFSKGESRDIAVNDESIIGLELEWAIQFHYDPAAAAAVEKTADCTELTMYWSDETGSVGAADVTVKVNCFSVVGGRMLLEYSGTGIKGSLSESNELYLIMEDGEEIPCTISGTFSYSETESGGSATVFIRYSEDAYGNITAIDITKAEAISINGETFPLA